MVSKSCAAKMNQKRAVEANERKQREAREAAAAKKALAKSSGGFSLPKLF